MHVRHARCVDRTKRSILNSIQTASVIRLRIITHSKIPGVHFLKISHVGSYTIHTMFMRTKGNYPMSCNVRYKDKVHIKVVRGMKLKLSME